MKKFRPAYYRQVSLVDQIIAVQKYKSHNYSHKQ